MINSFVLTDPADRDPQGHIQLADVFGYELHADGTATRVTNALPPPNGPGKDAWYWQQQADGTIVLTQRYDTVTHSTSSNCNPVMSRATCMVWRKRTWQPLAWDGSRLYVVESEQEAASFDPTNPQLFTDIAPRLGFYQVYTQDLNGDGINDVQEVLDGIDPSGPYVNQRPSIALVGAATMTIAQASQFIDPGATATDAEDGDLTAIIQTTSNVNTNVAGSYTVTYKVTDSGGLSASVTRTVVVQGPSVSLSSPSGFSAGMDNTSAQTVTLTDTGKAPLSINRIAASGGDFSETNNCGSSLAAGTSCSITVTFAPPSAGAGTGSLTVTSNVATSPDVVALNGTGTNQPPGITLVGPATLTITQGSQFKDPGATAMDPEDGNLTSSIQTTSNVNTAVAGDYAVTYKVTDSGGLSASVTRTVVVQAGTQIRLAPSQKIVLPVTGQPLTAPNGKALSVPTNVTAVALNVTDVDPDGAGYITVWPCSVSRPLASNVNYVAGEIVPNGVIAPVGSDGKVCFYSSSKTDLVVDIAGYFTGNAFTGVTPQRLVDTRKGTGAPQARVTPASPLAIQITGLASHTAAGAATTIPSTINAASLNVTVVNSAGQGYVTVYPCDSARPLASNVNFAKGQVVANGVIAPVGSNGRVCVYASTSTDVVVDLEGWFGGGSFTGATPDRLVDTRKGTGAPVGKISGSHELAIPVVGQTLSVNGVAEAVPTTATAVALNVTAVDPDGNGYITVYPCGESRPLASNLNYVKGDVVANNVIAPIGKNGEVCVYSSTGADVVVDISGWFAGTGANGFVGATPDRLIDTRKGVGAPPQ